MSCAQCTATLRDHGHHSAARKLSEFDDRTQRARIEALSPYVRFRISRMLREQGGAPDRLDHLDPAVVLTMLDSYEAALDSAEPVAPASKSPTPSAAHAAEQNKAMKTKPLSPRESAKLLSETAKVHEAAGMTYDEAFSAALREQTQRGAQARATPQKKAPAPFTSPTLTLAARTATIRLRDHVDYDVAFTRALKGEGA